MTVFPSANGGSRRLPQDYGVTLLAEQFTDPLIRCNIWHVAGRDRDLVIDTGLGVVSLRQELEAITERPVVAAVATHGHFDHIGGLYEFDERIGHGDDLADGRALTSSPLVAAGYSAEICDVFAAAGYPIVDPLLMYLPTADFDPLRLPSAARDADGIRRGRRCHRPRRPGVRRPPPPRAFTRQYRSWDAGRRVLFSGDTVYDGEVA